MHLKSYTDYAMRVLMHLALEPDRLVSIAEIARRHRISHNHLMKVVHDLRKEGFVEASRGRSGGIRLARAATEITVGEIVRHAEGLCELVDCSACVIAPACGLTAAFNEAQRAFMSVLDSYSLADLVGGRRRRSLRDLLGTSAMAA